MDIRTGVSADIEEVLAFWLHATSEPSSTDDAASVATLLEHAPDALVIAGEGDAIVGTAIVGWDGWRGTIYRLAVDPAHRRRGIATRLVKEAERRLRMNGAQRLHLIVAGDEGAAHAFWTSAGYQPTTQLSFVKNLAFPGA